MDYFTILLIFKILIFEIEDFEEQILKKKVLKWTKIVYFKALPPLDMVKVSIDLTNIVFLMLENSELPLDPWTGFIFHVPGCSKSR